MVVGTDLENQAPPPPPPRCKITLWIALNNKLLTWDNGLKRGWIGPGRCSLCKSNSESINHLFIFCPYAAQVMKTVKEQLKVNELEQGKSGRMP
jgi:hypothetical protein